MAAAFSMAIQAIIFLLIHIFYHCFHIVLSSTNSHTTQLPVSPNARQGSNTAGYPYHSAALHTSWLPPKRCTRSPRKAYKKQHHRRHHQQQQRQQLSRRESEEDEHRHQEPRMTALHVRTGTGSATGRGRTAPNVWSTAKTALGTRLP